MCGLAGIVGPPGLDDERNRTVRRMTETLAHRGPDGEGYAQLDGCDLGFRRLAIIDPDGACPPFANEDRSIWAVCNGEIYNAGELTAELVELGHRLETGVDTEVIPHLYEERGLDFVDSLDGMFAFALWDARRRRLVLGRDRAGEKPLFYREGDGEIVFVSEIRALLEHPDTPRELDPEALQRYLLHDYFPAPLTPLAGVRKLPAGHLLIREEGQSRTVRYWDLAEHFGSPESKGRSDSEVAGELRGLLTQAVRRRKRSDAPVGVFLSGGLDSSTVLALLAEQNGPGIPVFALGHEERAFDESCFARETARRYDADFHPLILSETDLEEGLRRVSEGFDEPLGDASTLPTHLLSLHARQKVKVVLSGEGADELFAGYPTYLGDRVAETFQRIPAGLRRALLGGLRRVVPVSMGNVGLDYLLEKFADSAELDRSQRHHTWFGSHSPRFQRRLLAPRVHEALAGADPFASAQAVLAGKAFPDRLSELLYTDFSMYLQDDLLTKVDRATMLASLEARAPFLDHELAQYVAGLPSTMKLRGRRSKHILRLAVEDVVPADVLTRRKRGFNIPFSRWLLHGLGQEMRRRFSAERVEARGLFSPAGVTQLLDDHLARRRDHRKRLFNLLAFDLWCDRTFGESAEVPLASSSSARVLAAVPGSLSG